MHSTALPSFNGHFERKNDRYTNTYHVTNVYDISKQEPMNTFRTATYTVIIMYSVSQIEWESIESKRFGSSDLHKNLGRIFSPRIGIHMEILTAN